MKIRKNSYVFGQTDKAILDKKGSFQFFFYKFVNNFLEFLICKNNVISTFRVVGLCLNLTFNWKCNDTTCSIIKRNNSSICLFYTFCPIFNFSRVRLFVLIHNYIIINYKKIYKGTLYHPNHTSSFTIDASVVSLHYF